MCCTNHESLWLRLRPFRLPRDFSCIIVGVIYHPPSADNHELYDCLINSLDKILARYPLAGVVIMGDFNQFDHKRLCRNTSLTQIVKKATRGNAILDLIFTNMKHWYNTPEILPAIGQSDHMSIFFQSLNRQQRPNTTTKVWIPKRNPWNIKAIGRFLNDLDWSVLTFLPSCQEKCDFFYNIILMGLDTILPKKSVKLHCRDKPWITPDLKFLISQRQKAFVSGNLSEYNMLRNKVIREVKQSKFKFYESQISNLKNSKPRKWWSAIKSLAGYFKRSLLRSVEVDGSIMQGKDLATAINKAFVAPSEMLPPLTPLDKQPIENPSISYFISAADVEPRLRAVKSNKSPGPDSLPNWFLNTFSFELAEPVSIIFNASIKQACVPYQWKEANVIPVPKTCPVKDIRVDLRPISLTATLSKVLESFLSQWIMNAIKSKLDPKQFGSLKGSSTVDALISMFHCWFSNTDGNSNSIRVFLLDFSKAFDRINHKILVNKMLLLDIDKSLINWVVDFLTNRKQRVKIGSVLSDWLLVNGGVPQGTILGPLLFLIMVNDLAINYQDRWKYVDDTSLSETIGKDCQSNLQSIINEIDRWCSENDMMLNRSKCKDLIISFTNNKPNFDPLVIAEGCIPQVSSAKILGLNFSSDLSWSSHIKHIVSKASKRLFFLRVLKRNGVEQSSLIKVYTTCIRTVLEYACQVWNFSAPEYLKEEIERVQKRALRVICPHLSYRAALLETGILSLTQRRKILCKSYFGKLLHPEHKLNELIPKKREFIRSYNLRNDNHLGLISCNTTRFYNTFIPSSIVVYNNELS